ncbi:hypothetical protein KM886_19720 [Bacillus pumilus]|nr:hypothetical protein [Bacillus pumilus]
MGGGSGTSSGIVNGTSTGEQVSAIGFSGVVPAGTVFRLVNISGQPITVSTLRLTLFKINN